MIGIWSRFPDWAFLCWPHLRSPGCWVCLNITATQVFFDANTNIRTAFATSHMFTCSAQCRHWLYAFALEKYIQPPTQCSWFLAPSFSGSHKRLHNWTALEMLCHRTSFLAHRGSEIIAVIKWLCAGKLRSELALSIKSSLYTMSDVDMLQNVGSLRIAARIRSGTSNCASSNWPLV